MAIPDFAAGAMENLGLRDVPRDRSCWSIPLTASTAEPAERVALVVAHEIAHMWFGDLGDDGVVGGGLWLNEAFATFMEYLCASTRSGPSGRCGALRSARSARNSGCAVDALHTTRPIEFPVHSPADAMAMLDPITYQKGASVLRMLEQYLGADVFRDGIRRYLADHAYCQHRHLGPVGGARVGASGEPVAMIMDSWILQGGHPVVSVRDGELAQSPFQFRARRAVRRRSVATWLGADSNEAARGRHGHQPRCCWATQRHRPRVPSPTIVNAGGSGVYRTSYEPAALTHLTAHLSELTELERAVLLGDTWALARAGVRDVTDVLTIARGLGSCGRAAVVVDRPPGPDHARSRRRRRRSSGARGGVERAGVPGARRARLGCGRGRGRARTARACNGRANPRLRRARRGGPRRGGRPARFDVGRRRGRPRPGDRGIAVVASMARPGDAEEMTQPDPRGPRIPRSEERLPDRPRRVRSIGRSPSRPSSAVLRA